MSSAMFIYRNIIYPNCRRLNIGTFSKNTRAFTKFKDLGHNSVLPARNSSAICRRFSTQPNSDYNNKPAYTPLMEFPETTWPGFFQMLKCWLTFKLGLPTLDEDFDLLEFISGSQHAIYVVSNALSKEDYGALDGLVTPEAIEILKKNVSKMSDEQKKEIALEKKEFFFCFPSEISVQQGTEKASKIVEVVMVYHLLRNWKDLQAPFDMDDSNSGMKRIDIMHGTVSNPEYSSHAIVCNYRFIREFGSGDKSWSINVVNQFRLCDIEK